MKPLSRKILSIELRNKEHEKTSQSKGNGKEDEKRGGFLSCNMWYVQDRRVVSLFGCTGI
jgi:hypothetical protein